ncbi:MAG: carboxypeptidase-like regulatory domain-containing protein [Blastocatellia bacterium]
MRTLFAVLLTSLFVTLALAQNTSISGSVTDPQNNALPGATITITNKATGATRTVTSAGDGAFQIPQVPPGLYRIKAEAKGFASIVDEEVQVLVSTPLTLNMQFKQVGGVADTVTITGGEAVLNTTDATIGNTFDNRKVMDLPLLSRNIAGLLSLQPGVTGAIDNPNSSTRVDVKRGGYVNGARSDQSNVTLDGVDVNEQQGGAAFFTVLRLTPDSLQEFRVTTTNANADQGRSSGAQLSLVTRGGTNQYHGSLYEYNRLDKFAANDWFNNKAGVPRPKLLRNNFGGAIGGPIWKDKIFFFFNYEGFRESKGAPVVAEVPLPSLGQGIVRYKTANGKSNEFNSCPAGTPSGVNCLSRAQISAAYVAANGIDPGTNSAALAVLASAATRYVANDTTVGDGLNTGGYRFNASLPVKQNTFIGRFDFVPTQQHNVSVRLNYQNDTEALSSAFSDTPSRVVWRQPKGIALGEAWTISNSLVNNFRYGLTRAAFTQGGDSNQTFLNFRFIFQPLLFARGFSRVTPIHNVIDDLSWTKGSHSILGGTNMRFISNQRSSLANAFDTAIINPSYYDLSGDVVLNSDAGNPIFSNVGGSSTDLRDALASVIGRYSQYAANINYDRQGNVIAPGTPIKRDFRTQEYDFYLQDAWKLRPNLTVNYGLRWSNSVPVYEANGLQVKPVQNLGEYFDKRVAGALAGKPVVDPISIDLAGKANGRTGFYRHDWNNFAPTASFAWSPNFKGGLLGTLFGENKTSFRGGYRLVFDRLGGALAVSFDGQAILGFSSSSQISANTFNVSTRLGPLFTGVGQNVRALPRLTINPSLKFPLQQPSDQDQRIESALDDSITTPYSHTFNFSIGRDLGKGFSFETSYVGRMGRKLLVSRDIMHFNNLKDPKSGVDFYTAMRELISYREKNSTITAVPKIAYFENILPGLAGTYSILGTNTVLTASQAAYRRIARTSVGGRNTTDYTFVQTLWNDGLGYGDNLFYHPQYAAFGALGSIGTSDYHALQVSLRKRLTNDLNFDFNYTWGHSLDIASGLEPTGSTVSGAALILNPLDINSNRGNSDFDIRHIMNANYNYVLPFGKGKKFLSNLHPVANAILGGWQSTGIFRWNTGLPARQPFDDGRWATNWNVQSNQVAIRQVTASPTRTGDPNLFSDRLAAYTSYRNPYPGEVGDRNVLREPGYAVFDLGLYKAFNLPWEGKRLVFRAEAFNLGNVQHFTDVGGFGFPQDPYLDTTGSKIPSDFGKFTGIQGAPRQMQFALRIEF